MENQNRAVPPAPDQLEVSFFGPNYGECIVIHLGSGEWAIVDSCLSPSSGEPQSLEYFDELGVSRSAIRIIIATHFDDDHIRGLAKCIQGAPNADFVMSGAIASEDFVTLLNAFDRDPVGALSGVKEMTATLRCLRERGKYPCLAHANKTLLQINRGSEPSTELIALSPSDVTVINGHININKLLQSVLKNRIRLPECNRNDRSIALWVKMGNAFVILGADLEETGDANTGWSAIVLSTIKHPKASAFKIPHHGSKTSHHDGIWSELLEKNPPSVIIPWKKGFRALPTRQDIERLQKLTDKLYVTSVPQNQQVRRRPEVDQMIRSTALDIRKVNTGTGQVRLRANTIKGRTEWSVELFKGAKKIEGRMAKTFFDQQSSNNRNRPWLQ